MKRRFLFPESVLLSLACAWASVTCLMTAFSMTAERGREVGILWLAWAVVCGLLLLRRRGLLWVLLLSVAALGLAWHKTDIRLQTLRLLGVIARFYDSGYGWGVPELLRVEPGCMDLPLGALGMWIILAVSNTVCRRRGTTGTTLVAVLPLMACLLMTDTVPDTASLFVLMLCVILLMLTASVRRESAGQGTRLTLGMLLPVTLALAALFHYVPKESYVNKSEALRAPLLEYVEQIPQKLRSGAVSLPNFNSPREQVNLSSLSAQPQLRIPVAEVTAQWDGAVYLRSQDFDLYTGTAWQSTVNRQETLAGTGDTLGSVTVSTLNSQKNLLLPVFPDGETILIDGVVENDTSRREYTVSCRSSIIGPQPGAAWVALPLSAEAQAKAILRTIPGKKDSVEATAEAVARYVSECAVYDRETRAMPAGYDDFAIWFLQDADRGYCVHFATAAAVLLRAAGIPARYVTGYRVEVQAGVPARVTSNEAHAWVEYYNYRTWNWTVLEATPADLTMEPTEPETVETTVPLPMVPTQQTRPPEETLPTETAPPTEPEAPEETHWEIPWETVWRVLAVLAALAAIEGQRLLRIRIRQHRQSRGSRNEQAAARWPEIRLLARLLKADVPEEVQTLTEKALFSQHELTAEELQQFTDCAAASRRALKAQSWYRRIVYRYWYAVL